MRLQATAPWHAALRKREELLVVQVSGGGEVIRVARDGSQQVRDAMLKALLEDDVLRLQRGHSFEHLLNCLKLDRPLVKGTFSYLSIGKGLVECAKMFPRESFCSSDFDSATITRSTNPLPTTLSAAGSTSQLHPQPFHHVEVSIVRTQGKYHHPDLANVST